MSFSVIIPSRTQQNLVLAVMAIREAGEDCRIIVVDDFEPGPEHPLEHEPPGILTECTWVHGVKPFVFARNMNIGIAAAGDDDVVLLNDDALLKTYRGFSFLAGMAKHHQDDFGIISAAATGGVGNLDQLAQAGTRCRPTHHHTLVFVCVYIRRAVLDAMRDDNGHWLDERYTGYGYDDDDACETVRHNLKLGLGVFDGCLVDHQSLPSTFRGAGGTVSTDLLPNRERFIEKWGFSPGKRPAPLTAAAAPKW